MGFLKGGENMTWLIALMVLPVAATLGAGFWLELKPRRLAAGWLKGGMLANVLLFGLGLAGVMLSGVQEVLAAEPAAAGLMDISLGKGLALIGIGLPTALAAIGKTIHAINQFMCSPPLKIRVKSWPAARLAAAVRIPFRPR